ncbi:hypothetical protein Alches_16290 [Alicyclobacillus hesperidum subsp. aegles]|uniref:DUF2612 domain-containing protein n=1 Tax=Alicyclobacillus hesperidum TaxID=89784 RepID=UPI00222D10F9|nr:DUF2612 domain-containing protein [Alicyclobacillus hesperidum]GLG01589.1 hypothetical protein Alches_16290 [Alicyclobacillus hesperidum subsp. aegles]
MAIEPYLSLITSEHADKPNYMAWLSAILQKVDDSISVSNSIPSAFELDTAEGAQLDILGQLIGQPRDIGVPLTNNSSILDDDHYRLVLQAKIVRNQWDGTVGEIYDIWNAAFPGTQLALVDNQDMTMTANITNLEDNLAAELVTAGLIIPRPLGVELNVMASTSITSQEYIGSVVSGYDIVRLSVPS